MIWRKHRHHPSSPREEVVQERAEVLVREAQKAQEAQAAAERSVDSVYTEAIRLRDSHAIARELRAQVRENGWAERIALSMMLRDKGN